LPRIYRPWFAVAALLGSAALVTIFWDELVEFKRDEYATAQDTASSAELRPTLAEIAWRMFRDQPLVGCGLGHYVDKHVDYLAELEKGRNYVQHNAWLSLLAETGLIGLTLFALLTIAWLHSAWRLWRADNAPLWMRQQGLLFIVVAANYVMNGMFHDMSIIPMVNMILFFFAGVTVNLEREAAAWEEHPTKAFVAAGNRG
jgi:O-antigen ligase